MIKKGLAALAIVVVAAVAVAWMTGLRVSLDGSGTIPRFASRGPDYDALEAHRARQRDEIPLPAPAPEARPAAAPAPGAEAPVPASTAAIAAEESSAVGHAAEAPRALPGGTAARPARTEDWPDFRGPKRDGRHAAASIRTEWPSSGLPLLWKQPVGLGYASFTVAGGRAFTIEQRRDQEVVAAYDVDTGREMWTVSWDGEFRETMGGDGPRATPVVHEDRLYALGAEGELRALDADTGATIWRRNILQDNGASNLDWGMAASPLVVDDKVIVLPGGRNGRSVVAYHRLTGEPVWRALDDRQAYVSPMVETIAGRRQLLVVSASRIVGLTVDDGRLLWEHPWSNPNGINVAQPLLLGGDRIFLSASYGGGAEAIEIERSGDAFSVRSLWRNQRMKNRFTSSVLHEGYIYGLDESILACLDASTGELQWKGGRYGYGQLMIVGDRLIVLTEDGDVVQVQATPEQHRELARFDAIDGKTWNHPVIAGGRLLVRNLREMAAFDIRAR